MPVLDCSVRSCYYNKENKCCLDGIHVEGHTAEKSIHTACGSFRAGDKDNYSNSCGCDRAPRNQADIKCDAVKCEFNECEKCTAKHIGIAGDGAKTSRETECSSFIMK